MVFGSFCVAQSKYVVGSDSSTHEASHRVSLAAKNLQLPCALVLFLVGMYQLCCAYGYFNIFGGDFSDLREAIDAKVNNFRTSTLAVRLLLKLLATTVVVSFLLTIVLLVKACFQRQEQKELSNWRLVSESEKVQRDHFFEDDNSVDTYTDDDLEEDALQEVENAAGQANLLDDISPEPDANHSYTSCPTKSSASSGADSSRSR